MYNHSCGVEKDEFAAVAWYKRAAEQNLPEAQYNLGVMYRQGRGVELTDSAGSSLMDFNVSQALIWYKRAAQNGYKDAFTAIKRLKEGEKETKSQSQLSPEANSQAFSRTASTIQGIPLGASAAVGSAPTFPHQVQHFNCQLFEGEPCSRRLNCCTTPSLPCSYQGPKARWLSSNRATRAQNSRLASADSSVPRRSASLTLDPTYYDNNTPRSRKIGIKCMGSSNSCTNKRKSSFVRWAMRMITN